jgi:hypothetical protein
MNSNPYTPPLAPVDIPEAAGNSTTAILIGVVIGTGTAYIVLTLVGLAFFWILVAQGVPAHELYVRAYQSTTYLVFAHFLGFLCSLPGGYWSARLDRTRNYGNALFAGSLVSGLALLQFCIPYELPIPYWSRVASIVLPLPAFFLGAVWWQRKCSAQGRT